MKKWLLYMRIALDVTRHYCFRISPFRSGRLLKGAALMLWTFRHFRPIQKDGNWKVQLYYPAWPTPAFFHALDAKFLKAKPGPATVVMSMTKACRYKCPHCYQRRDAGSDLPEDKLIETTHKMREAGVAMFNVEGGEPMLRFDRLIRLLKSLDTRSEVWVNITGDQYDLDHAIEMRKAGAYGVMISLHSASKQAHDAFCGVDGAFENAQRAVTFSRAAGLMVALNSMVAEAELRKSGLDDLMELALQWQCDFVQLIHPKAAGQWIGNKTGMQKDPALLRELEIACEKYNGDTKRNWPCLSAQVYEERAAALGCTAGGIDRFYVNAAGEVQACEFLNLSFGNVSTESFEVIFARMREVFAVPCEDWMCCTQAAAIAQLIQKEGISETPVPWKHTQKLVASWNRGKPTKLYRKLGVYPQ